jgi:hypothetical protein
LEFEPFADRPVLEGMDCVPALLDELDECITIHTEQVFRLAIGAQLFKSETARGMSGLLGMT